MLTIKIKTDNAAFADDSASEDDEAAHAAAKREECARLLRSIAGKLENATSGSIFDRNGNKVGTWSLS